MSVIFIANVGNRDVQIAGYEELARQGARPYGEAILADWDTYGPHIQLPILGKALEWVARTHKKVDHVVLIASDQADERYRNSDTAPFADVIRRFLTENDTWQKSIVPEQIMIERVTENPADFDAMLRFYDDLMQRLSADAPADLIYLEISGGTPAMVSMLLLKGIEWFGERAQPLYVSPARSMPMSLDIGRQLTVDGTVSALERSLNVNQYHAALALLDARETLLREEWPVFPALRAVVEYARQRLNFNFLGAEEAIFGAERGLSRSLAERIYALAEDIHDRTEVWLLREVLHTAEISFRNGAYADFLGRAFRLSEGLSDYVVEHWATGDVFTVKEQRSSEGVTFNQRSISDTWLDQHVDAWEFLESKGIKLEMGITRRTLLALAEFFAGDSNTRCQIVRYLNRLDALGSYRNQMPFAHGYEGVSLETLKARYKTTRDNEILRNLKWLFEAVTGQPPGDNPYDTVNTLILDMIRESA